MQEGFCSLLKEFIVIKKALDFSSAFLYMAEGQGFEPWVGYKPTPVFKTGALNHSATLPCGANYTWLFLLSK